MSKSKSSSPATTRRRGRFNRWLPLLLTALGLIALSFLLIGKLRNEVWPYFVDETGQRSEIEDQKARSVLWQDPERLTFKEKIDPNAPALGGEMNQPTGKLEAAFSANGTTMVFVHWSGKEKKIANLHLSHWDGRSWSTPTVITSANSTANDRGPAIAADGRTLYFSSDREGGQGGYDLYASQWDGTAWGAPLALGTTINSTSNELGAALSADGKTLYFSSDRNAAGQNDLFRASRTTGVSENPEFAQATPFSELNSASDEVQVTLAKRGNYIFFASDRDRKAAKGNAPATGYRIYLSRVSGGDQLPPEQIEFNLPAEDITDPAVRMDGFDLLFSASKKPAKGVETSEKEYHLFHTTVREVFAFNDLSRWELFKAKLRTTGWRALLALGALALLIYILERWKDIRSLSHQCLAGSAALHLGILACFMLWQIKKEFTVGDEAPAAEIAISIDALAQEELALESEPEEAEIADSKIALVTDKFQSDFKIPNFTPQTPNEKSAPIISSTSKTSLVSKMTPSKESETEVSDALAQPKDTPTKPLEALPETFLVDESSSVALEEKQTEIADSKDEARIDPLADLFKPTEAIPQVKTQQNLNKTSLPNKLVEKTVKSQEIASASLNPETKDTDGELIEPHRGIELKGKPPELKEEGDLAALSLSLPGADTRNNPLLPDKLETPKHKISAAALTKDIRKIHGKPSLETVKELGGSDATEKAIGNALDWFTKNQEPDGHWDSRKHGAKADYDVASAGLALLSYYGWGANHLVAGKYQQPVKKALDWLIAKQDRDTGSLYGAGGRMYAHGIATIALCEAYGISKDPKLKEPAQKALDYIVVSQSPTKGGWHYVGAVKHNGIYQPTKTADTSVTSWQFMALHSGKMAGLKVPEQTFVKARRWLDFVGGGRFGGLYGYNSPASKNPRMIATGMFCRQLDLVPPTDQRMMESAQALKLAKLSATRVDYYYLYYGTLALYQHQGPIWTEWNDRLKEIIPTLQDKHGANAGSWPAETALSHFKSTGRAVTTGISTLSLEVYYRLLPMYGFRAEDDVPDGL